MNENRKVTRVLVMLEYGPEDPANWEIFDLTALTSEIASRPGSKQNHAQISLEVTTRTDYAADCINGKSPLKNEVGWKAMIDFQSTGYSGYLDDAINASMPDSFTTQEMRKKLRKIQNKAEQISKDILVQRIRDAAAIRHTHPIARVTEKPALAEVAGKVQP